MIIAIDFDGTIVDHAYPRVGLPNPGAIETIKALIDNGHSIILWTMRSGQTLEQAVQYLTHNGIKLFGINCNPDQHWSDSPKAYAQLYIDDAALGASLVYYPGFQRRALDWSWVELHLLRLNLITDEQIQVIRKAHLKSLTDLELLSYRPYPQTLS